MDKKGLYFFGNRVYTDFSAGRPAFSPTVSLKADHQYIVEYMNRSKSNKKTVTRRNGAPPSASERKKTTKTRTVAFPPSVDKRTCEALIEAFPDVGFVIDARGVVLACNRIAFDRCEKEVIPGRSLIFNVFPHLDARAWKRKVLEGLEHKKTIRFERQVNGQYYLHNIHPVIDKKGDITFVVIFIQDVTSHRYAENALKESEQKYRDLVENISDSIYALNEDGTVIYVNPAVVAFLGLPPEEVTGRSLTDFLHPTDALLVKNDMAGFLSGRLSQKEYRFVHRNGSLRWGRVASQPVEFRDEVIGYQGVITDITQYRSFNLNLLKAVQENVLTNMTSSFGAEIGVPLQRARDKLLSRREGESDIDGSIRDLMHDLEGISVYLKNMNAFMEKINEESAVSDINALVENGLILIRRQCEKSGIEVSTALSRRLEPVPVDPFALVQAFINIINYSIEAHAASGNTGRVTVETHMDKDKVVIDIRDQGASVTEELSSCLADPFFRHRRHKGTVIGLAIARQLVENQSGEFQVATERRTQGLHIRILLPAVIQSL